MDKREASSTKERLECAASGLEAEGLPATIDEHRPPQAASTRERSAHPDSKEAAQSEQEARRAKQAKIRSWLRRKDDELTARKELRRREVLRILEEVQQAARAKDEQQAEQRRQKLGRLQASARRRKDFELELLHACAALTAPCRAPMSPRELPPALRAPPQQSPRELHAPLAAAAPLEAAAPTSAAAPSRAAAS